MAIFTISSHLKNPKTTELVLVAFVFFDVEIKVFYESKRREKG